MRSGVVYVLLSITILCAQFRFVFYRRDRATAVCKKRFGIPGYRMPFTLLLAVNSKRRREEHKKENKRSRRFETLDSPLQSHSASVNPFHTWFSVEFAAEFRHLSVRSE